MQQVMKMREKQMAQKIRNRMALLKNPGGASRNALGKQPLAQTFDYKSCSRDGVGK